MTPLIIDKTGDTPSITLDKTSGTFTFKGTSIPENTNAFFEPVLSWIDDYLTQALEETIVNFKFDYFNTSSTKTILDILIQFKSLAKNDKMLIVNWYFPEEDEDMLEAGEGFSQMMRYPFNFIKRQ